jgi:D-glycero-D-manno-heptose 1,7-bisphosphate phosphatase
MAPDRHAVFLDRDGTVIEDAYYPNSPEQVRLLPGAAEALRRLSERGFLLVLVSNQSGIGRGLITQDEADGVHRRVVEELGAHGVELDDARYCPHAPEAGCRCRKPEPGLILDAARDLGIDLRRSVLVGDTAADLGAGRAAGVATILLGTDADDWPSALSRIEELVA